MRLTIGSTYGAIFTRSFETTLLCLNGDLGIGRPGVVLQGLTQLTSIQQHSAHKCEDSDTLPYSVSQAFTHKNDKMHPRDLCLYVSIYHKSSLTDITFCQACSYLPAQRIIATWPGQYQVTLQNANCVFIVVFSCNHWRS